MRVESSKPMKNGGWLHSGDTIRGRVVIPPPPDRPPPIDAASLVSGWRNRTTPDAIKAFAGSLGVNSDALTQLGACYAAPYNAWAFPMRDGQGNIVGVRLRDMRGRKWAVRGSKQGVFIPACVPQDMAFITEGPTDTAAALSIGLFAIGRPSCNCGGLQIKTNCLRLGIRRVVMVADHDIPGIRGAQKVADEIGLPYVMFLPPTKDIREAVMSGLTREMVMATVNSYTWRR